MDSVAMQPLGASADPAAMTVLSFNVLCKASGAARYFKTDEQALAFEHRSKKVAAIVASCDADIVCLQEVSEKQDFPGYVSLFKGRTNKEDGCAIMWREERFTLERHGGQVLDQIVYTGGVGKAPIMTCNSGLYAILRDRRTGQPVLVANVQLFWNRVNVAVQANQAQLFLESMYHCKQSEDLPIILCSDLACEPGSPVVELVRRSLSPNAYGPLHSAYPMDAGFKTICEQLRRDPVSADAMVDYIWHSGHLLVTGARGLPVAFEDGQCIPSAQWPSNHAPLLVQLSANRAYVAPTRPNVVLAAPAMRRMHEHERSAPPPPPPRARLPATLWQKKVPCKFFPKGTCTMGQQCPFGHQAPFMFGGSSSGSGAGSGNSLSGGAGGKRATHGSGNSDSSNSDTSSGKRFLNPATSEWVPRK